MLIIHKVTDGNSQRLVRDGPPTLLVNPSSATCGRAWETTDDHKISLNATHYDMLRFPENDRDSYEKVRDVFIEFVDVAPEVIKARLEGLHSKGSHCPLGNPSYTKSSLG